MVDVLLLIFLIVIYVRITEDHEVINRKFRKIEDILDRLPSRYTEEHSYAIKQGLSKVKKVGGKLGPPVKLTVDTKAEVLKRYALGSSMREISEQMNLSVGSVHKALKQARINARISSAMLQR